MLFVITLDTEADDQWARPVPRTTRNIAFIPRFQELCRRYAFPPTYLCTYEVCAAPEFDQVLRPLHERGDAEIGAHLHPWSTPPFDERWDDTTEGCAYPSELPPGLVARKLEQLTTLIAAKNGRSPTSYRAGRWGLSASHIPILLRLGYIVDCSVTPLVEWNDRGLRDRGQDFRHAPARPYVMSWGDPAREGSSGLLEIPVTILHTNAVMRREPALRVLYEKHRKSIAAQAIERAARVAPHWLRPFPAMTSARLRSVADTASELDLPVIELMFHSSELMPGGAPHNPTPEAVEGLYARLNDLFEHLTTLGVEGVTLSECARRLQPSLVAPHQAHLAGPSDLTWAGPGH